MSLKLTRSGARVYEPDGEVLTQFFWDQGKFACIQGPIGSGTSTAGIMRALRIAHAQEPDWDGVRRTRFIFHARTYPILEKTLWKTYEMWFPEQQWGPMVRSQPGYHRMIDPRTGGPRRHPSGDGTYVDCEIIFLALPDEDVARATLPSWEITGFFSNEVQNTEKGVITMLLSRCGRFPSKMSGPGASWFGGWADMNAPYEGHWVPYMRGDIPLPSDMSEAEKQEYRNPDGWTFYVQPPGLIETIVDGRPVYAPNPKAENTRWLVEPYMQKIGGMPKEDIDRFILNKVGLSQHGKPVYPTFSDVEHSAPGDIEAVEGHPIIVGLDFGRDPAAVFGQCINGNWLALAELIGENESAQLFAPRVKRLLSRNFQGFEAEFWGDPRGGDGTQATETTAFDIFQKLGMRVLPATTDNAPELRRSAMEAVLGRRSGFKAARSCLMLRRGLSGGYHYAKIKGREGMYAPRPVKNSYSHVVEAMENMILGGGEGYAVVSSPIREKAVAKPIERRRVSISRRAR